MYFVKIGQLLYLRCPGTTEKCSEFSGLLTLETIKNAKDSAIKGGAGTLKSENPLLRGIPATSSRTSPPLVVTLGTTGV